jgi:hypothetical protein
MTWAGDVGCRNKALFDPQNCKINKNPKQKKIVL